MADAKLEAGGAPLASSALGCGAPRRIDLPLLCEIERRRQYLFPADVDQATKQLCWKSIYEWAKAHNYEFARAGRDWKYLRDQIWSTNLKCRVLRRIHLEGDAFYTRCSEMDRKVLDIIGRDGTSTYKPRGERAPSGRRSALAPVAGAAPTGNNGKESTGAPTMVNLVSKAGADDTAAACASPHFADEHAAGVGGGGGAFGSSPGTPTLSATAAAMLHNLGLFNALQQHQQQQQPAAAPSPAVGTSMAPVSLLGATAAAGLGGAFGDGSNTLLALAANLAAFSASAGAANSGGGHNNASQSSTGGDSAEASDSTNTSEHDQLMLLQGHGQLVQQQHRRQQHKRARLSSEEAAGGGGPLNLNSGAAAAAAAANAHEVDAARPLDATVSGLWPALSGHQSALTGAGDELVEAQTYKAKLDCVRLELQLGISRDRSKYPELRDIATAVDTAAVASVGGEQSQ